MTSQFIQALRDSFERRLLHPGAQTHQISQAYMNTIKVLRVMDPTDNLLEGVAVGIRTYLRGQSDTVRYIISSQTDRVDHCRACLDSDPGKENGPSFYER